MSTRHQDDRAPMSVKIPADIDQPDKILYGLTTRQLGILAGTAAACLWIFLTLGPLMPLPVLVAVLVPVLAVGVVLAVARHDGMSLDRYCLAALRHLRAGKERVTAGEPVPPPPAWCLMRGRLPEPLRLPVRAVRQDGVLELAGGEVAAIVRASTLAFGLRTAGEQAGLVAVFGRWLNSLDAPVQVLVQARPVDLTGLADHITQQAPALPDPALEQAACAHAAFLTDLGAEHDLLIPTSPHRHHRRHPLLGPGIRSCMAAAPTTPGTARLCGCGRIAARRRGRASPGRARRPGGGTGRHERHCRHRRIPVPRRTPSCR